MILSRLCWSLTLKRGNYLCGIFLRLFKMIWINKWTNWIECRHWPDLPFVKDSGLVGNVCVPACVCDAVHRMLYEVCGRIVIYVSYDFAVVWLTWCCSFGFGTYGRLLLEQSMLSFLLTTLVPDSHCLLALHGGCVVICGVSHVLFPPTQRRTRRF